VVRQHCGEPRERQSTDSDQSPKRVMTAAVGG